MTAITKTTVGTNMLRDASAGAQSGLISYVSIGTSNVTPTAGDTRLGNEVLRKAVTTYTNGATGEVFIAGYFGPSDAIGVDIEEVGYWGGNATSMLNSGTLIGHGLYTHNPKTGLESITFSLDEVFS